MTPSDGHRLLRENAELKERLDASQREVLALRAQLATLQRRVDKLVDIAGSQRDQLTDLTVMLRHKQTKSRAGTLAPANEPPDDPPDGDDDGPGGGAGGAGGGQGAGLRKASGTTRKPRAKGTGRRPVPDVLSVTEVRHTVDACAHCGCTKLLARDTEVSDKIDALLTALRCERHLREVKVCTRCHETTTASMPPMPCERSKFTCAFLAWLVTMKFSLLVPLDRIRRHLQRQGVDLPESTLVHLIDMAADLASKDVSAYPHPTRCPTPPPAGPSRRTRTPEPGSRTDPTSPPQ
ncbi:MAG TPA: transposase, partial [Myxococcota bacterium]|nr:transposase [Myxococcota bacterium]